MVYVNQVKKNDRPVVVVKAEPVKADSAPKKAQKATKK